jgi:hypothetical protein
MKKKSIKSKYGERRNACFEFPFCLFNKAHITTALILMTVTS